MIFTIGHSNHDLETFLRLLENHMVETLCDVRSIPYSRWCPWFNREALAESVRCRKESVDGTSLKEYVFLGSEIGGMTSDTSMHSSGMVDFDKVASSEKFLNGLNKLVGIAGDSVTVMMCSEKDPISCHRLSLVCRRLRPMLAEIEHIMPGGNLVPHSDMEDRLVKLVGLDGQDLMYDFEELVERAYDVWSRKIAWKPK